MSIGNIDPYYSRHEVSNSDLTKLKMYFANADFVRDATAAYRFGNLVDAMITEKERCDFYSLKVDGEQFYQEEWDKALRMRDAFFKDEECATLMKLSAPQHFMTEESGRISYSGIEFEIPRRCKWDLWMPKMGWGADIKSTFATSQKQFEAACRHFDYPRSRAWYMDIAGSDKDMMIGISKENYKIFKIRIKRGDAMYQEGLEQYQELAFRWWTLFGNLTL